MDLDDYLDSKSESLLPAKADSAPDKQDKLQKLRQKMDERMNSKRKDAEEPKGRDLYLQKVTNFLITSFFLNLAIEHVFTYSLVHDYINGYLQNETYLLGGRIEGNNYCFMLFYFFRLIGFALTDRFLIDHMQGDVETNLGRKKSLAKSSSPRSWAPPPPSYCPPGYS
jgi:hypothetical protein